MPKVILSEEEKRAIVREHYQRMGKKGGTRTKELHGSEHFSKAGKKGMEVRWGKKDED